MNILFTNNTLAKMAGTERAIHDTAIAMAERGHHVAVFSAQLGDTAEALRERGVPSTEHPADLPWAPDVIHGHHEWETTFAALCWPRAALLSFCRGAEAWQEAPCRAAWTHRWVAIDAACARRLRDVEGIAPEKIVTIPNGIDLTKFPEREEPLPASPACALVFSNYATEQNYLPAIREACDRAGLELDVIGSGVKRYVADPAKILPRQHIVFAKGRAALEALACGCAVIVCDAWGLGPLVDPQNFQHLREENFGFDVMKDEITPEAVTSRIARYHAEDAMAVSRRVRETCGLKENLDALEDLYQQAIADGRGNREPAPEDFADLAAAFLRDKAVPYKIGRTILEGWVEENRENLSNNIRHDKILHTWSKGQRAIADVKALKKQLKQARRQQNRLEPQPAWRRALRRVLRKFC